MTPAETYAQKRVEAVTLIENHAPSRLQQSLIDLLRPAIALNVACCDDDTIPIGASKFGGAPDVAAGFEWPFLDAGQLPHWKGQPAPEGGPLMFVCQINLSEIADWDIENYLPKQGVLSFFADLEYYEHRLYWFDKVEMRTDDLCISPYDEKPLCCQINFGARWTLPPLWTTWDRYFGDFKTEGKEEFTDALEIVEGSLGDFGTYMFGYQAPYHDECWPPSDKEQILLCQFSGPDEVWPEEGMGGAMGFLTIAKSDLARQDFSDTWFWKQYM